VQKAGDFFADAAGRAGYEGLAACQIKHVLFLL
jgi:hypothetical protein